MAKHGFEVTKQFHLPTAWQATFAHGSGGRTIGINSEVCYLIWGDFAPVLTYLSRQLPSKVLVMPVAVISSEFHVPFPEFCLTFFFANICCFLGVAVALAIKAALEKHDIALKIVL